MNAQFKKGILELCVLSMINKRDYYGYELVEKISESFAISEGTIYPILRRLTEEKYFETYLQESSSGPPRKYYRMTSSGREVQKNLYNEWIQFNSEINELLKQD